MVEKEEGSAGTKLVLVVEDEPILLIMAGEMVEDAGLEPVFARDADEAISILESRDDIKILFTDVRMPGGHSHLSHT